MDRKGVGVHSRVPDCVPSSVYPHTTITTHSLALSLGHGGFLYKHERSAKFGLDLVQQTLKVSYLKESTIRFLITVFSPTVVVVVNTSP